MGTDIVDINIIKHGLLSKPPFVPYELEWVTDKGYDLFRERQQMISEWYEHDEEAIITALKNVKESVSENIIFIDLGAGRCIKSIKMMRALVKDHPNRRIFYIPIDLNDTILEWDSYIKEFDDIRDNVVDIKPLLCDMMEALSDLENIIKGPYEKWDLVFAAPGMPLILSSGQLVDTVSKSCELIKCRGTGTMVMSFIALTENTKDQWERCLTSSKIIEQLESVLSGLKEAGRSDLDTKKFNYIRKYEENFTTPGISGHWSGCTYYAQAKEDMTLTFDHDKLKDVRLNLLKDDLLRLSVDVTSTHFQDVHFLNSLAEKNGVEMEWWQTSQKYGHSSVAFVPKK